jgi:hypothetical protein
MHSRRISRRARLLSHLATALLVALPMGAVTVLAMGAVTPDALRMAYGVSVMPDTLATGPTLTLIGVEALKMAVFLWVIWCVRAWLIACADGRVFEAHSARHIQRIGTGLLVLAVAHIIGHTVIVGALTWGNPVGQRALAIRFGSTELFLLLTAGLMTLFGWIQAEAARLAAENEGFV